ncbi:MAG: YraN family protein [Eubacteriaceae bacterium]
MKAYNNKKGNAGESLALSYLENLGYLLMSQNYRKTFGEIDLILKKDETIVFVEVKFRDNLKFGFPKEAVNLKKQRRIIKTALWYLKEGDFFDWNVRFDVVEIYFDFDNKQIINHFINAFQM